jgi:hypothetical protein
MNSLERMNYIIRHDDGTYTLGHRLLYLGKLYEQSWHRRCPPSITYQLALSLEACDSACNSGCTTLASSYATATCPAASSRWMVPLSARFYATGDWVNRCRKEQAQALPTLNHIPACAFAGGLRQRLQFRLYDSGKPFIA